MRAPRLTLALAAVLSARTLAAQDVRTASGVVDFGFETPSVIDPRMPRGWSGGGSGYEIALDSVAPYSGRYSVRIRATPRAASGAFGIVNPALVLPGRDVA